MDKKRNLNKIHLDNVKVKLDWERDTERVWEEKEVEDSVGRLESLLYKFRMKSYHYEITKEGSECCLKLQGWPIEKLRIMFQIFCTIEEKVRSGINTLNSNPS